ncbi:hypothetical protein EDB86DRAFT_2805526 [Lactarius hatsudake]|nr:hypothetical protein EDB86DRAFT_2805526 [Lactarius hatsudake]
MSIRYLYVCLPSPCSFATNIFFDEVLHHRFKTFYFSHHKWPQEWIEEALSLLRMVWRAKYRPDPINKPDKPPQLESVDFDVVLNYRHQIGQGDALEEYLSTPPLPKVMDPIGYWLKQQKAGRP